MLLVNLTRPKKSLHLVIKNPAISLHFQINPILGLHQNILHLYADKAEMSNAEEQLIRN
jgi:hypothetical protein